MFLMSIKIPKIYGGIFFDGVINDNITILKKSHKSEVTTEIIINKYHGYYDYHVFIILPVWIYVIYKKYSY